MKFQPIALVAFLVSGVIASDLEGLEERDFEVEERGADLDLEERGDYGYGKKCTKIEWSPGVCKHCPHDYGYGSKDRRDEYSAILERGYGETCKKECPKDKRQCEKKDWDYNHVKYKAWFESKFYCADKCSYKVKAKIDENKYGSYGKQYLEVVFDQPKWNKGYLGIYDKEGGIYDWKTLNYKEYCHGNKCTVPVDKLPGYPKLCGDTLYLAVYSSKCEEKKYYNKGNYGYHKDDISYFPLKIDCEGKKKCVKECCCP